MKKRPTSVTVIAWYQIISCICLLVIITISLYQINSPFDANIIQYAMYGVILAMFVSAFGILNGQNWARFLFVICNVVLFVISIILLKSPIKTAIPSIWMSISITVFLFLPKANHYFKGTEVQNSTESNEKKFHDQTFTVHSSDLPV